MSHLKTFLVFSVISYLCSAQDFQLGFTENQESQGASSVAGDKDCGFCRDPQCEESGNNEHARKTCDCGDTTDVCVDNWCVGVVKVPEGSGVQSSQFVIRTLCDDMGDLMGAVITGIKFSCFECGDAKDGE